MKGHGSQVMLVTRRREHALNTLTLIIHHHACVWMICHLSVRSPPTNKKRDRRVIPLSPKPSDKYALGAGSAMKIPIYKTEQCVGFVARKITGARQWYINAPLLLFALAIFSISCR